MKVEEEQEILLKSIDKSNGTYDFSASPGGSLEICPLEKIKQRVPVTGHQRSSDRVPALRGTQNREPQQPSVYLPGKKLGTLFWGI